MKRTLLTAAVIALGLCNPCEAQERGNDHKHQKESKEIFQQTVTTKQLLPNATLGVSLTSPLVLGLADPSSFRSPNFRLQVTGNDVHLKATGTESTFAEMSDRRNDSDANLRGERAECLNRFKKAAGDTLSNVGVSLAINVTLKGEEFALLSYRAKGNRFMLLSGYVEPVPDSIGSDQLFWDNATREANEELLVVGRDGLPLRCVVVLNNTSKPLDRAYDSLTYSTATFQLVQTRLPQYLPNMYPCEHVECDRSRMPVGFQYSRLWNSGQLVASFSLEFDKSHEPHWLFHAEDRLDANSGSAQLVTMLSRDTLVLAKLDDEGRMTPNFFRLMSGELQPVELDPNESWMSEAFALRGEELQSGVVETDRIRMSDYLKWR